MPTALLLHGMGSAPATLWRVREWLEALGHDVTAPALLGHGGRGPAESYELDRYAADVLAHGDGWDLVLGHSLGGSVALLAEWVRPEWAKRLVLVEPAIALAPETIALARPSELAELRWTRAEIEEYLPRWDARDVDEKLAAAAQALPEAVSRTFAENRVWDLETDAAALAVPTLVLTGDRATDYSIVDEGTWRRLAAANPRLEFVVVPGTGHSPHRDDPAATRAILEAWLAQTA